MTQSPRAGTAPAGYVPVGADPELDRRLIEVEDALKAREFERAVALAEDTLEHRPDAAEAKRLLSAALRGCGRDEEAVALLRQLLVDFPENPLVWNSLGAALRYTGELDESRAAFQRAVELAPRLVPAWYNLAVVLLMLDRLADARGAIERAIELAPDNEPSLILRSDMLREQGQIKIVVGEYRRMIAQNPRSAWGWLGLANLKNVKFSSEDRQAIQRALGTFEKGERERTALLFALSKGLDDEGRYAEAFAALKEGNEELAQRYPWDAAAFGEQVDSMLAAFTPPPRGSDVAQGDEVIFVVSLPRSGSTLVEQILASHPVVDGGGELGELHAIITRESKDRGVELQDWAQSATPQDWERMGKQYLQDTAKYHAAKPRFVDKMLGNWFHAGAAIAMLPQARFVVSRRDPLETAFSCYRQMFPEHAHTYSYSFDRVAAYWKAFDRMCRRWSELYPGRVFDMVYEDLLADQEGKTRELLAFCGLPFDPACLRFHETQRNIKTISSAQVREPLRRDTARAPYYGPLLDPLRAALGLPAYSAQGSPG